MPLEAAGADGNTDLGNSIGAPEDSFADGGDACPGLCTVGEGDESILVVIAETESGTGAGMCKAGEKSVNLGGDTEAGVRDVPALCGSGSGDGKNC